ncbi:hypothetical protein [Zooshikella sp. RANM57]|uniref:hypothetical protein n=1 Tax=Zooshikella sp. RANM57 TaxID=3425863 RepID=UPI003D6DC5F5
MDIEKAIHDAYGINLSSSADIEVTRTKQLSVEQRLLKLNRQWKKGDSKRLAILHSYKPVCTRADNRTKTSVNNIIASQVVAGKVIAAVEALPDVQKAWVKWCYAPTLNDNVMHTVALKQRIKLAKKEAASINRNAEKSERAGLKDKHLDRRAAERAFMKARQLTSKAKSKRAEVDLLISKYESKVANLGVPEILIAYFKGQLLKRVDEHKGKHKKAAKVVNNALKLVPYWAVNYKALKNTGREAFAKKDICVMNGLTPNHYAQTYSYYQGVIEDCCEDIEQIALPHITDKIRIRRNS